MNYRIRHEFISRGYNREICWTHPGAGVLPPQKPGDNPTVVVTMTPLKLTGNDEFYALHSTRSTDLGETWTPPQEQENFGRVRVTELIPEASGRRVEKIPCDFRPNWHAPTSTLLNIGHTAYYYDNKISADRPRETAYATYDQSAQRWNDWRTLAMPDAEKFRNAGAGSAQRVDLENGDILLPIYFRVAGPYQLASTVVRCRFDGETLEYCEGGNELYHPSGRGLYEPSLTKFGNRFFLTMRNDLCGYYALSDDGLHFSEPQAWRFDDGAELGNYNTQQHWVARGDALFLVYTRRGLNNDHVFRHRAPLVMAQVNPKAMRVLRDTERVIIPERGARLGNFDVAHVNENETWITVAEWMQTTAPNSRFHALRALGQRQHSVGGTIVMGRAERGIHGIIPITERNVINSGCGPGPGQSH